MKKIFEETKYVLDPHGAVGYLGIKKFLNEQQTIQGVFLETAHPAKFKTTVEETIGQAIELPPSLKKLIDKPVVSLSCSSNFDHVKELLLGLR